jgi:hypothetical protein
MAGAEAERELLGKCNGGEGDDLYQIECEANSSDGFHLMRGKDMSRA